MAMIKTEEDALCGAFREGFEEGWDQGMLEMLKRTHQIVTAAMDLLNEKVDKLCEEKKPKKKKPKKKGKP